MLRYWILCKSEDNYEIARKQGLISMSERAGKAMQHIDVGDLNTFSINRKTVDAPPTDPAATVQQFRGMVLRGRAIIWRTSHL